MFCLECKSEYQEGVEICVDCNTTLVGELPEEKPPKEVKWIPLHELPGQMYAEMVKEILEKEGIPSYIKANFLTGAYGIKGSFAGSRATLYVPEEHANRAGSILNQMLDHI